jgi:hypothetical protein
MAVGIVLSPIPIVAVVLMLTTARARSNGLAFVAGWLLGLAVVGAVVLGIAGGAGSYSSGEPATWVSRLKIALGVLFLAMAVRQFQSRPAPGQEAPLPKWMARIDQFKAPMALGLGVLLTAFNPKNLPLAAGAAATSPGPAFPEVSRCSPIWCSRCWPPSASPPRCSSTSRWEIERPES